MTTGRAVASDIDGLVLGCGRRRTGPVLGVLLVAAKLGLLWLVVDA